MVAPNYAEKRRSLAHLIGLGRKKAEVAPEPQPAPAAAKPKRGRPKKLSDAMAAAKEHVGGGEN